MLTRNATPDRLSAFSDGVFAVIITILVLDLKPPNAPNLEALVSMWPAAMGYGVSYLFIAIVWVNHHHLLRHADVATTRLIWSNFAHLFTVSFIPFSTAWIAQTELAAVPVSVYATVFAAVNATSAFVHGSGGPTSKQGDTTSHTHGNAHPFTCNSCSLLARCRYCSHVSQNWHRAHLFVSNCLPASRSAKRPA